MAYRLHCVGASGNSFKVALFLNCAGLDWKPVGVDFAGGQTRGPAWRAATSGMGEIPVLECDGRRMSQSGAILIAAGEAGLRSCSIPSGHRAPIQSKIDCARALWKRHCCQSGSTGNAKT
ncbi:glutathione S-transferase N-terminal domain-containing protein [Bradyrhizobium sp. CCBAU 25338]|uniref:glutathione S-transferase N-terminal domain-containing protein n=1 Tax=Bradyrhizobium sp. CCBAU 25338 TaxID=1641877 RepID=UPI0023044F92|nr:glutathione S-transferase N-terminal domain-containing protein [Bradyrhizobium sp. CCBAU 25338]